MNSKSGLPGRMGKQAIARLIREYCSHKAADIQLAEDGIYFCQYLSSGVWKGLEDIRQYLEHHRLDYVIQEI
jgi:hypothetical protein